MLRVVLNAWVTKTTAAEILAKPATQRRQVTMTISLNPLRFGDGAGTAALAPAELVGVAQPGRARVRDRASNTNSSATPKPNSLLDIGMSPTHAAFAPATPDRSPPLATKESDSPSSNEWDWRASCNGGPRAHQVGSRKHARSDPSEALRQAQAVQEVH